MRELKEKQYQYMMTGLAVLTMILVLGIYMVEQCEDEKLMAVTSEDYIKWVDYNVTLEVMEKTSKYVNGKTLNDFAGANVVGQIETLYDSLIYQLVDVNHLTPLGDVPTIITSINSKRADITILEEPVAKGVIETNPNLTYIKLTNGFNVSEEDVCVAIAVAKGNAELQEKVIVKLYC